MLLTARGASAEVATGVGAAEAGAGVVLGAAALVAGGGSAVVVVGAALVGVVVGWLCGAVEVVASAGVVEADDGDDVAGDVVLGDDVAPALEGVSLVVVEVVAVAVPGGGGALGVLVGSTAGTSAADDGATV